MRAYVALVVVRCSSCGMGVSGAQQNNGILLATTSSCPLMQSFHYIALMVVSHEWSTAWDPSESNLGLLRLSHLACPAAAYGFNLVPQQPGIRDFRSDRPCRYQ